MVYKIVNVTKRKITPQLHKSETHFSSNSSARACQQAKAVRLLLKTQPMVSMLLKSSTTEHLLNKGSGWGKLLIKREK
jgi:hypothetical protein